MTAMLKYETWLVLLQSLRQGCSGGKGAQTGDSMNGSKKHTSYNNDLFWPCVEIQNQRINFSSSA